MIPMKPVSMAAVIPTTACTIRCLKVQQLQRERSLSHLYPCQAPAQTRTSPQIAPTNGRVSNVSAITDAAAAPTINTQRKTASSEMRIQAPTCPRPR